MLVIDRMKKAVRVVGFLLDVQEELQSCGAAAKNKSNRITDKTAWTGRHMQEVG